MNDANAEAGAFLAAAAAESTAAGHDAIAQANGIAHVACEPNVGIAAAKPPGFRECDVSETFELRLEDPLPRRLRDEIGDEVARV